MSEALTRLQTDVSNLVSTTSKTLTDIQNKLNSMASAGGASDADLSALADQVETVTNQLNAFDATLQGASTVTGGNGADTISGS